MSLSKLKKQKKILIVSSLLTCSVLLTGFIHEQKQVDIEVDGQMLHVRTFGSKPESILKSAGVIMREKDTFELSTTKVEDQTKITVYRAIPVEIAYHGQKNRLLSSKRTVGELVEELNLDKAVVHTEPGLDTKLTENMKIHIKDVSERIVERTEEQLYEIVRRADASMEKGAEEIVQQGRNGVRTVTVKETYHDGIKTGEQIIEEKITEPAKPEIRKVGTRDIVETSRGAARFRDTLYMEATAYLPTDGSGTGITATGMQAQRGVAAVDPNVIPLGSRLYVPGYGMAVAADTGSAILGDKIDLCMEGYAEAIHFGRRIVKVYILE